jgi:hypothetical protein
MGTITDKGMQANPTGADQWLTESFGKGHGALLGRITPAGLRSFYFRYTGTKGQVRLPIGPFHPKGNGENAFTTGQARDKAKDWSRLYREGCTDLRERFHQEEADKQQALVLERQRIADEQRQRMEATQAALAAEQRRITVRRLFDDWRTAELQPRLRADGKREGRKDGGQYVLEQFTRHVFPTIGATPVEDLRKADLLALLDTQKAAGKMRTANVLLAELATAPRRRAHGLGVRRTTEGCTGDESATGESTHRATGRR